MEMIRYLEKNIPGRLSDFFDNQFLEMIRPDQLS